MRMCHSFEPKSSNRFINMKNLFFDMDKKEDLVEKFSNLPKRKLSEIEKQLIFILIEKSKIQRERSMAILNKGFMIFFAFIIVAAMSNIFEIINKTYIIYLFLFSITVLIVAAYTYQSAVKKEENTLDALLDSFLK